MPIRFDIVVLNKAEEPVLIAEIKGRHGTSKEWARQLRRNLLLHGGAVRTPYFMLLGLDQTFVWSGHPAGDLEAEPDVEVDTKQILEEFRDLEHVTLNSGSGSLLEMLTTFWITRLLDAEPEDISAQNRWIVDSGLLAAIHDGRILKEALVGNGALP